MDGITVGDLLNPNAHGINDVKARAKKLCDELMACFANGVAIGSRKIKPVTLESLLHAISSGAHGQTLRQRALDPQRIKHMPLLLTMMEKLKDRDSSIRYCRDEGDIRQKNASRRCRYYDTENYFLVVMEEETGSHGHGACSFVTAYPVEPGSPTHNHYIKCGVLLPGAQKTTARTMARAATATTKPPATATRPNPAVTYKRQRSIISPYGDLHASA